ncbi:MAG TPA: permease-like cell division protein FtsX [Chitinophagaceae bacterium]|nr:permease-like cell division protein FtsX [Chitinophagaceae bacterium]
MSQSGKASIKRGKPSYFMSILGVTLVLLLLGVIGWLVINANKLGAYFKENVEIKAELRGDLNPKDSIALMNYISSKPYVKSIQFITKAQAEKIFLGDGNKSWEGILDYNPLPNSISFKVRQQYMNADSLVAIQNDLQKQTYVSEVTYPKALVDNLNKNIRRISIILLAIAALLAIVVIILIDNTIRLAMFSNRFLIKTMQMVGATRWFIAKPMNVRAIINGAISGLIAVAAVLVIIFIAEGFLPELKAIHDNSTLIILFIGLIILGICITLFSTHRSVVKYLKMKLDDLY